MQNKGMYVYCVAHNKGPISFGKIGIEQNEAYTVSSNELCAVVHRCIAEPYKSDDAEIVKGWVKTHQTVIDEASKRFDTIIPLSFDVIIKGNSKEVTLWLENETKTLKEKLERIKGRQEFGIQIFWDKELIAKQVAEENEEIKRLREEIKQQSKGKAFFSKQNMEKLLKKEVEKSADKEFKQLYNHIRGFADDIKVEKLKEANMLLNLSCLVYLFS
ncbi:MAG: GvpL/GvpF family gas vesicle protein [Nanoarchaeota archaeon]|nr:GvpL/GvpF family gas vesicle protein [Nanoarchaeota archaeon]